MFKKKEVLEVLCRRCEFFTKDFSTISLDYRLSFSNPLELFNILHLILSCDEVRDFSFTFQYDPIKMYYLFVYVRDDSWDEVEDNYFGLSIG